jgi:hypothetical protein
MSWRITPSWAPADADAAAYIAAVEAADGQALEEKTKIAIDDFVLGCKADGIWSAIKASCILAGARTLSGALVPLVGTAPTNFNFVSGDYNRKTGLVGNTSTKYLNSNRNNNADPQNSKHVSVYVSLGAIGDQRGAIGSGVDGGNSFITTVGGSGDILAAVINNGGQQFSASGQMLVSGFKGVSRSASTSSLFRTEGFNRSSGMNSITPVNAGIAVFRNGLTGLSGAHRLAFYSIGESLNLALLDARVTALVNAFAAAIP